MDSLNHDNQADVFDFSRYPDDLLNIVNLYLEGIVNQRPREFLKPDFGLRFW